MTAHEAQDVIEAYLDRNNRSGYDVAVTSVSSERAHVDVTVTFLAGRRYCCAEPGCHLPWEAASVVKFAAGMGITLPPRLTIGWHVVVKEGALLECLRSRAGGSLESDAYEYDHVTR